MINIQRLIASGLFLVCGSALSQTVIDARGVATQPIVIAEKGKPQVCGLRLVGLDFDESSPKFPAHTVDVRLILARGENPPVIYGVLNTEARRIKNSAQFRKGPMAATVVKLNSAWLQSEGGAIQKQLKSGAGDDGLSSMASYDADHVLSPLVDMATGAKALLIGIRIAGEDKARVFRFAECVPEEHRKQFSECASEMFSQVERELSKTSR
ncbi:MAG: hypothetical protein QE485_15935 [Acidovorax sp.]|uniref:hypothetical protein n=1 Tax=Acidovorax sp. TaxID=1872122 RepID=UPI002609C39E|nr:hypothetical protein [Acidovorax sp.]MDH4418701.1 hypothetical protein [Acidovorax sp.]